MERAFDVVLEFHTKAEIERLMKDIDQKCRQIAELIGGKGDVDGLVWEDPKFFAVLENGKKKQINLV